MIPSFPDPPIKKNVAARKIKLHQELYFDQVPPTVHKADRQTNKKLYPYALVTCT